MMKISKKGWWVLGSIGVAGLGTGIYFLFFKDKKHPDSDKYGNLKLKGEGKDSKGGIKGGIQTTKEGQASAITEPNWKNPYDMTYAIDVREWVNPKKVYVLKKSFAEKYAKELKSAKGLPWYMGGNDNEEAVKNVFKRLKDKVQVANLSKAFYDDQEKDMWEYLVSFLEDDEMEENVYKHVRKLPNYRIVK